MSETRDEATEVLGVQVKFRDPAADALLAAPCRAHAPLWTLPEKSGGAGGTTP